MTVKAIAGTFGTWAIPADAPAYIKTRDAERFAMVMTDLSSQAWVNDRRPPTPSWAEVMATSLTPARIAYGAASDFTTLPA